MALLTTICWVEGRHRQRSTGRRAVVAGLAVAVRLSVVALLADHIHFLTDALGGVAVGAGAPLALPGPRPRTSSHAPVQAGKAA